MARRVPEKIMETSKELNVQIPFSLKLRVMECAEIAGQNYKEFVADALEMACAEFAEILDEYYKIGRGANEQIKLRKHNNALKKQGQH